MWRWRGIVGCALCGSALLSAPAFGQATATPTNTPTITQTPTMTAEPAPPARKYVEAGGRMVRVQGVAETITVKNAPGILHRIVMANADAATQTLTVTNGSTVRVVLRLASGASETFVFEAAFSTAIRVTPSDTDVDALVVYD